MKYNNVYLGAMGYELPKNVVYSDELEERLAPLYDKLHIQPGQLEAMTGIYERRYWDPGFVPSQGAALAAKAALDASNVPASEIGCLVYGGVCRDAKEPATACHVAGHLIDEGIHVSSTCCIHDIGNACLGVVDGIIDVANRIELGQIRAGLVVSCESAREIVDDLIARMNHRLDMGYFKTAVATLTGGSAAVALVIHDGSFEREPRHKLLGGSIDAAPQHHMLCRWGLEVDPQASEVAPDGLRYRQFMATHSVDVLEHGVELGHRAWNNFLSTLGWTAEDVDRLVTHQVGAGHREAYMKAFGVDPGKDFPAFESLGNTGTVALPLAMALAAERGFLEQGHNVGLLGIGSGLNCIMLGVSW